MIIRKKDCILNSLLYLVPRFNPRLDSFIRNNFAASRVYKSFTSNPVMFRFIPFTKMKINQSKWQFFIPNYES